MKPKLQLLALALPMLTMLSISRCAGSAHSNNEANPSSQFYLEYNGNSNDSGSAAAERIGYAEGSRVTVADNDGYLTKAGWSFAGWNTLADGTGVSYQPGDTLIMGRADIVLYARWLPAAIALYNLQFDGNGYTDGSLPQTSQYPANNRLQLPSPNFSKSGFTFTGWNTRADGSGISRIPGSDFYMPYADVTFFAIWEPVYSLTYDANGGTETEPVAAQNYRAGETFKIFPPAVTRPGYQLKLWNSKPDGTGLNFSTGWDYQMPGADLKLYAVWSRELFVTYDANGGSGEVPVDTTLYLPGQILRVAANNSIHKEHAVFLAWNTAADGSGTSFNPGDIVPVSADVTHLYAIWAELYTLSYDLNGGRGSLPASVRLPAGSRQPLIGGSSLSKPNLLFSGWNTAADGNGVFIDAGGYFEMPAADVTLYAVWEFNRRFWQAVTISENGRVLAAAADSIFVSTDGGENWERRGSAGSWKDMCASSDGATIAAVMESGPIHLSRNYGEDWITTGPSEAYVSIGCSGDGNVIAAASMYSKFVFTTDGGSNWNTQAVHHVNAIAVSGDGQKIGYLGARIGSVEDFFWFSEDQGQSFTARHRQAGRELATSDNGAEWVSAIYNGLLSASVDSGNAWSSYSESTRWYSVTMSGDGVKMAAAVLSGEFYFSEDSGRTWIARGNPRAWTDIAISRDGDHLIGAESNGQIRLSHDGGQTWQTKL